MDGNRTKMDGNGRMDGKMDGKRARLVRRKRNSYHGGTSEIWDIGNECGIYVDFNPRAFMPSRPETMAFPLDLSRSEVTSWGALGTWYEDATGGKAIRELGYEIEEGERRAHRRTSL